MRLPYPLLLGIALVVVTSFSLKAQKKQSLSCKELSFRIEVTDSEGKKDDGEVRIVTADEFSPVVHLISRDENKSKIKIKELKISSVSPGVYILMISDFEGVFCPTTLEVTIH